MMLTIPSWRSFQWVRLNGSIVGYEIIEIVEMIKMKVTGHAKH